MEGGLRILFLKRLLCGAVMVSGLSGVVRAADDAVAALDPAVERREVQTPRIDSENFELGLYAGLLSVEDFGAHAVFGVRLAYHLSEDFFVEAAYGQSDAGLTSFERLSGAARLIEEEERTMRFYNLSLGVNVLPGEAFLGARRAYANALYLIGGAGSTDFAGDERFTFNFGAGYRLLFNDWLALRLDVRDHVFDMDLLGVDETTHNLEVSGGVTVFF